MKMSLHAESACKAFADRELRSVSDKIVFLAWDLASVKTDIKQD